MISSNSSRETFASWILRMHTKSSLTRRLLVRHCQFLGSIRIRDTLWSRVLQRYSSASRVALQGVSPTFCLLGRCAYYGRNHTEHLRNLSEVLGECRKQVCVFIVTNVPYASPGPVPGPCYLPGIQPTEEKVAAIQNAPPPQDVHQLKSFLGLLNFYAKPKSVDRPAPLYRLLQKNIPWQWREQQAALRR